MDVHRQVNRLLDEEHHATLELLGHVGHAFARASPSGAAHDPSLARLAASLASHIERDITRHFEFEERELFPRLEAAGEGDIVGLLMEEHVAIREVTAELLPLARAAAAGTLEQSGWEALKRGALEMAERLTSHIHKETMALLPMLDNVLDDDTDRELAFAYAAA